MPKENRRYWFSAFSRLGGKMVHVISARSIGKARSSMGRLSEEYTFSQLTWGDINRLVGVAPPTTESDIVYAEGHLLIEYDGRVISIEIAN